MASCGATAKTAEKRPRAGWGGANGLLVCARLLQNRDGVGGRKDELLVSGERVTRRNAGAKERASRRLQFEEFAGPGVDLLADGGPEAHGVASCRVVSGEGDGFGAQGEQLRAVGTRTGKGKGFPSGDPAAYRGAQKIGLADKLGGVGG